MKPAVSIIVPVYNAQASLPRCIESVLNQTFTDFELLLINDGSTDDSGQICDEYAQNDSRIKVFHNENHGVSFTRNYALEHAEGEYIQFIDSDDWITPDATQQLIQNARKYSCDMVISDFYRVINDRLSIKGDIEHSGVLTREEFASHMMDNPADFYYGVLWNKLYRNELIKQHSLQMNPDINWCEDFIFNLEYIRYTKSIYVLTVPIYYYVKTKGSLVSQGTNLMNTIQMKASVFTTYNKLYKDILDEEEYQKARLKVYRFLIDAASDGAVLPSIVPSVQKLGTERISINTEMLNETGIMADAYREWKLLERCVESTAIQFNLTLNDALVLLALGQDGFHGQKEDLADLAHINKTSLYRSLSSLEFRDMIQIQKKKIEVLPKAFEAMQSLESTLKDWKALRFQGFTEEEIEIYKKLNKRIHQNVNSALK